MHTIVSPPYSCFSCELLYWPFCPAEMGIIICCLHSIHAVQQYLHPVQSVCEQHNQQNLLYCISKCMTKNKTKKTHTHTPKKQQKSIVKPYINRARLTVCEAGVFYITTLEICPPPSYEEPCT